MRFAFSRSQLTQRAFACRVRSTGAWLVPSWRERLSCLLLLAMTAGCAHQGNVDWRMDPEAREQRVARAVDAVRAIGFDGAVGLRIAEAPPEYFAFGRTAERDIAPAELQVDLTAATETVTAAAVMKMVDYQNFGTRSTLGELISATPADKAGITVHQLLTHSAGLAESFAPDVEPIPRGRAMGQAVRSELLHEPGTRVAYSKIGYVLLAGIVESRAGRPLEDFEQERLLPGRDGTRLGYARVLDRERSLLTPDGLDIAQASWGAPQASWHLSGHGGLVADMASFLTFVDLLSKGELVSAAGVASMFVPHEREADSTRAFGYGVVIDDDAGRRVRQRGGRNAHFSTLWRHHVDDDVLLVVAGTGSIDASTAADALMASLLGP